MPDQTHFDHKLLRAINLVTAAVRYHATYDWRMGSDAGNRIHVTKLDVTLDLAGSFLPDADFNCREYIRQETQTALDHLNHQSRLKIHNRRDYSCTRVRPGGNELDTCYQNKVIIGDGHKIMNIKTYFKTTDIIGKNGCHLVGNKLGRALGSTV